MRAPFRGRELILRPVLAFPQTGFIIVGPIRLARMRCPAQPWRAWRSRRESVNSLKRRGVDPLHFLSSEV